MGSVAVRVDAASHRRVTPVRAERERPRVPRGRRSCDVRAAARRAFVNATVLLVVIFMLGLGRVWLSVQAAEASLEIGELRQRIKAEEYRQDMLEVEKSALLSPSRVNALAHATMDMVPPTSVTYVDLPPVETAARADDRREGRAGSLERAVADALSLAAGEAEVLLIGDIGLAAAR